MPITNGFVDLTELPSIIGEVKPGIMISVLHADGVWEPMFLEEISPHDEDEYSTWKVRRMWVIPSHAYARENASAPLGNGYIARQYRISDKDVTRAKEWLTPVRIIKVKVQNGSVTSPSYVRIIAGVGYHQRVEETLNRRAYPMSGVALNVEAVQKEDWFHATFRNDWFHGIQKEDQSLMIHMGTQYAAWERIYDLGVSQCIEEGTPYHVYHMRLKSSARISTNILRDVNQWMSYWDANHHEDIDAFVYVNAYEQKNSSSLYVRADVMELIDVETFHFDKKEIRTFCEAGKGTKQILNTSRIRAEQVVV